jgi:hypothetical protein
MWENAVALVRGTVKHDLANARLYMAFLSNLIFKDIPEKSNVGLR